ncbi:hypothetical protein F01_460165 [Burkholderia cenocepacia]|nr:hypothetical protein F01_460165 [Burkholderia cenocepacia]
MRLPYPYLRRCVPARADGDVSAAPCAGGRVSARAARARPHARGDRAADRLWRRQPLHARCTGRVRPAGARRRDVVGRRAGCGAGAPACRRHARRALHDAGGRHRAMERSGADGRADRAARLAYRPAVRRSHVGRSRTDAGAAAGARGDRSHGQIPDARRPGCTVVCRTATPARSRPRMGEVVRAVRDVAIRRTGLRRRRASRRRARARPFDTLRVGQQLAASERIAAAGRCTPARLAARLRGGRRDCPRDPGRQRGCALWIRDGHAARNRRVTRCRPRWVTAARSEGQGRDLKKCKRPAGANPPGRLHWSVSE